MIKRSSIGLVVMIALLAAVGGPAQAGAMWSTWLYNSETYQIVRVYLDGTTEMVELSLPEGAIIRGQPAFTSGGNWVAYCQQQPNLKNTAALVVETLYDDAMAAGLDVTFPIEIDLGAVVGCDVTPMAFNTSRDDQIAISVVYRFPDDSPANPLTDPVWELLIVDLRSQSIVERLNPGSPAIMPMSSIDPNLAFLPRVQAFEGDTVTFVLEPFASGGWSTAPTYAWQVGDQQLAPVGDAGLPGHDQIALTDDTGMIMSTEHVWRASDPDLPPTMQPDPQFGPFNLLMYAVDGGDAYPILYQPGNLSEPHFVNDGRHIAVQAIIDEEVHWFALVRTGQLIDLPLDEDVPLLTAAPGGYVALEIDPPEFGIRLLYHQFSDDTTVTGSVIWQNTFPGWNMVWTQPLSGKAGQTPFPPLAS